MAKKIITIGKKGVTEKIQGSGPVTDVNVDYPNGSSSKFAGTPIKNRPQPPAITKDGGPFNGFRAAFSEYDPVTKILDPVRSIEINQNLDFILFTPDYPTFIQVQSEYGSGANGLFIGTNQIVNGGSLKWFVSEDAQMQSGEIDDNSPISQISPPLEPGEIGQYETSQGVTCYGYRARTSAQDFGYLNSAGGSAVQPTFFFCTVLAGNGPFLGSFYPHINSGGTGLISVIIEESKLTQDMLDNPVQNLKYVNSSFEVSAYICGIYGVRS